MSENAIWMATWSFLVSFFGVSLMGTEAFAHQDRIFSIVSSSGKVDGIPEKFGEVFVLVDWAKNSDGGVKVSIGSRHLNLPTCVSKHFMESSQAKMRISGSWYHDRSILPPYLSIELPDKAAPRTNFGFENGYKILLNLETAEIIEFEQAIVEANGQSMRSKKIDLKQACSKSEFKKLTPSKL